MAAAPAPATPHGAEPGDAGAPSGPPTPAGRTPLYVVAGIGVLLVIAGAITFMARARARAELESETLENVVPTVNVIRPERTPERIELELPGNITAYEEAPIYARVSGYLKHWQTDIGTHVEAGQLLAEIETPELDQELNQADAALAQAKANLEIAGFRPSAGRSCARATASRSRTRM